MKPVHRSVLALIASVILFLIWTITMNFRVETVSPSGLSQISYPYSGLSLGAGFSAIGLLLFAFTTAVALPHREPRKPVLGAALLSGGVATLVFASFTALSNYLDEEPRCFDFGCPSSTMFYYEVVYAASIGLAIGGIIAIVLGSTFLKRKQILTRI